MQQYTKNEPESIKTLFDGIAAHYDLVNGLISLGLHKRWNKSLVAAVLDKMGNSKATILDLCAGTGEIAFRFFNNKDHGIEALHLLDFSPEMLRIAEKKSKQVAGTFFFHVGDAQQLVFPDATFHAITLAYGIRNIQNPRKCLMECRRVLKTNGALAILELTRPKGKILQTLHAFFLRAFLPLIGKLVAQDKNAYSYLKNSVLSFMSAEELSALARSVGFTHITLKPLTFGIATIHIFQ